MCLTTLQGKIRRNQLSRIWPWCLRLGYQLVGIHPEWKTRTEVGQLVATFIMDKRIPWFWMFMLDDKITLSSKGEVRLRATVRNHPCLIGCKTNKKGRQAPVLIVKVIICTPSKAREHCNQDKWRKRNLKEKFKQWKWKSSISLQRQERRVCLQWWKISTTWTIWTNFHINTAPWANHASLGKIKDIAKLTRSLGTVSPPKVCRTSVALIWYKWPLAPRTKTLETLIRVQLVGH